LRKGSTSKSEKKPKGDPINGGGGNRRRKGPSTVAPPSKKYAVKSAGVRAVPKGPAMIKREERGAFVAKTYQISSIFWEGGGASWTLLFVNLLSLEDSLIVRVFSSPVLRKIT